MHQNNGPRHRHPAQPHWETIYPGQVLWLEHMLQTLAPAHTLQAGARITKPRPVVALKKTLVKVDGGNTCIEDAFMLAINSTSQEQLIEDRPHLRCQISPNAAKTSHFWFDTVASVPLRGEHIHVTYTMTPDEKKELSEGLGNVLQPEQQFFLKKLFNQRRGALPGQVWRVEIPSLDPRHATTEVDAVVLLRRGPHFVSEDEVGQVHFTPFLVGVLPDKFNAADLRTLRWNEIRLLAVHERSFRQQVGALTDETVGILLNSLRREVLLPGIVYQRPLMRHIFSMFHPMQLLPVPL